MTNDNHNDGSYLDEVCFQYFPGKIWETSPIGTITLRQFIEVHKNPKPNIVNVIDRIQEAAKNNDLVLKDKLKKENLFYFVPSVVLDGVGRKISNIVDYNPIMLMEFDKIGHAKELKERLFNNLPSVIASWVSPSGKGVKLFIRIPKPKSIDEYKAYYCGLAYHLSKYEGFDGVNYNVVIPQFISYDRDILFREDAEEWTQMGGKLNSFTTIGNGETFENIGEDLDDETRGMIDRRVVDFFEKIVDNGHVQLISISTLFGGWCAYYNYPLEDAEEFVHDIIENHNYLSKNINGYKKTASEMLRKGYKSPIEYNKKWKK